PAGDQQDRPRAAGGRVARGDGARREEDARRTALRLLQPEDRPGARPHPRVHRGAGHAGALTMPSHLVSPLFGLSSGLRNPGDIMKNLARLGAAVAALAVSANVFAAAPAPT